VSSFIAAGSFLSSVPNAAPQASKSAVPGTPFELARRGFDVTVKTLKVCTEADDRRDLLMTVRRILSELERPTAEGDHGS
jgi:hypothetical protein